MSKYSDPLFEGDGHGDKTDVSYVLSVFSAGLAVPVVRPSVITVNRDRAAAVASYASAAEVVTDCSKLVTVNCCAGVALVGGCA